MVFADRLIELRRKKGWSQEELAEQMGVSRQAVSKWEGAQAEPDLEKIIQLSRLFGVRTDYLLIEETEENDLSDVSGQRPLPRRVSPEEAEAFLAAKRASAGPIALGVFLCVLSPLCLFILGAMTEPPHNMPENLAGGLGMMVLLLLVAAGVTVFILSGRKTAAFSYLETEPFQAEYGVAELTRRHRENFKDARIRSVAAGVCICILSLIPMFFGIIVAENDSLFMVVMLSCTIAVAGVGAALFVRSGIIWESFDKLLQEGDYTPENKAKKPLLSAVSTAYWLIAAALYLGYSFVTENWEYSWILWPVAGVLYPAVTALCRAAAGRK